ncbi:FtsK/SpoIIIE domain-containing protein [Lactiplantibacillus plantarum]|uniref:FtsK/SpoIIIE domain-containing protein n=1 Tax=Lactiplantibacillus plantarum TaxID=1590 RepID=UPI001BAC35B0|nr:FtsK/SpoIIIE domain-containing protein [Lactiplantibacillus plantarum]MBS0936616.1 cell division protein FtsK [Lactiplantibacillus plantarum]MBS0943803.1 cell division protein FtsK [Lactiplantibacillus plantarum]
MITFATFTDLVLTVVLPYSIAGISFFTFLSWANSAYEKTDVDLLWHRLLMAGLTIGVVTLIITFFIHTELFDIIKMLLSEAGAFLMKQAAIKAAIIKLTAWFGGFIAFLHRLFTKWLPIYGRAFLFVWVIAIPVQLQALIWRVRFTRALNILTQTLVAFPFLIIFGYLTGHTTPVFDFMTSRLFVAKVKENLNDSYFDALQGVDDHGKSFKEGAGGSTQTQRIKAVALAMRHTHATVLTSGGKRHAKLTIRESREVETDELVKRSVKGLGQRLIAPNIRFQDSPVLNKEKGGYIFDSDVPYDPADYLGGWLSIFANPFSVESRLSNGGPGAIKVFGQLFKDLFDYIRHITPPALLAKMAKFVSAAYTRDDSLKKSKFINQNNIDLSIIPNPTVPSDDKHVEQRGNTISKQRILAKKVADQRIGDVTTALNRVKLGGAFDKVTVGGNNATYYYTLPISADIPTDFDKLQQTLSNVMGIKDIPQLQVNAGVLSLTMDNGVNIPIDFRDMLTQRPAGLGSTISGIVGIDNFGKNIVFELNDHAPHAMIFGKTGVGKTRLLLVLLYSIMAATDPTHFKLITLDGKGNSFEFLRTDNPDSGHYHPNPFLFAQPADGSSDIRYSRALIKYVVKMVRDRIEMFKKEGLSDVHAYNKAHPDNIMPEILFVADEFSAIVQQDKDLKASELAEFGTADMFEYLAKMARSAGIRLILANQSARKELIKGTIAANIVARLSMGVSESIESDIAMPGSKIALDHLKQQGEFYTTINTGTVNPEHGNAPFISDDVANAINDNLEQKFGHQDYVVTRQQIMAYAYGDNAEEVPTPEPLPNLSTSVDDLVKIIKKYPTWSLANREEPVFSKLEELMNCSPKQYKAKLAKITLALQSAENVVAINATALESKTNPNAGDTVATIAHGDDQIPF